MILVAALDIPTREEIDNVIWEAEQILIGAVLDDRTDTIQTRRAAIRTRLHPVSRRDHAVLPNTRLGMAMRGDVFPWARSPPKARQHSPSQGGNPRLRPVKLD
jgi:hypothetical protein